MSRADIALAVLIAALPVSLLWPRAHVASPPAFDSIAVPRIVDRADLERPDLLLPRGPAALCGAPLTIREALVDPDDRPDRDGEAVALWNPGVVPLDLEGWRLSAGRRALVLPSVIVGPGETLTLSSDGPVPLRPLRLANHGGALILRDPCGLERARVLWGGDCPTPPPGWWLDAPGQRRVGPARSVTGGADGGCGQT